MRESNICSINRVRVFVGWICDDFTLTLCLLKVSLLWLALLSSWTSIGMEIGIKFESKQMQNLRAAFSDDFFCTQKYCNNLHIEILIGYGRLGWWVVPSQLPQTLSIAKSRRNNCMELNLFDIYNKWCA